MGSFHRLNMPWISHVESQIPIAFGDHSFSLNLGGSSFLRLKNLHKIFGAMTVCSLEGHASAR